MKLSWWGRNFKATRFLSSRQPVALRRFGISNKVSLSESESTQKTKARLDRITSRLPKFLQGYTVPLVNAPLSHVTAFLLLHELTAVAPLFALAGTFHYTQWLPSSISNWKWASDGMEKFGRYFRRKGWLMGKVEDGKQREKTKGRNGSRIVLEFATAYAITKALLPLRLLLSVWATPWFAKVAIIPGRNVFRRIFSKLRQS